MREIGKDLCSHPLEELLSLGWPSRHERAVQRRRKSADEDPPEQPIPARARCRVGYHDPHHAGGRQPLVTKSLPLPRKVAAVRQHPSMVEILVPEDADLASSKE